MIKAVWKYHDKDECDIIYESGRMRMVDTGQLPKTARRFMDTAKKVIEKKDYAYGPATLYIN